MTIPPGLSEKDFADALNDFRKVVGKDWVFTIEEHINAYRDPYSPRINEDTEAIPSAAVAPDNVEEVQAIVKIANQYKIPLWVISSGKNFGYGGPESRVRGSVIIDVKRMNRILEINEKNCYALVEPGVSHYDLWMEIQKRGLSLWMDGPSPAYSSIVACTTERGVGYGLGGERINQQCGMEVVLPTGDLLRTGMGAMSKAKTWQQYKYGLGPWVDGMFSQSNLGIVTKMGIWLVPQPPAFRNAEVYVKNFEDVVPMIDTLRSLRLGGVIANSASAAPNFGGPIDGAQGPGGGYGMKRFQATAGAGKPGWRVRMGFYGYDKVVETNWEQTQDEFSKIPGTQFASNRFTAPYNPDEMLTEAKLAAGIPSFQETSVWSHGGTFASLVLPFDGKELIKFFGVMSKVFEKHGQHYHPGALHNHNPHCLIQLVGARLSTTDKEANHKAVALMSDVIKVSGENGYGEYRTPIVFMDEAARAYDFNNNALMRFNENLKDTLDPNGVLAPGKNGIWPKRMRKDQS